MSDFFNWLSSGSASSIILIVAFLILVITIVLIYIIAFFQGREIHFWPPKIGSRPIADSENEPQEKEIIAKEKISPSSETLEVINFDDIQITPIAENDCEVLSISYTELKEFLLSEAKNHPHIFSEPFTSLPLVFMRYVLIISWDDSIVLVERVLNREQAYPLNDPWTSCLSLYRKATILPYRSTSQKNLVLSTFDAKRTLKLYRKLANSVENYLNLVKNNQIDHGIDVESFYNLLNEAEFAMAEDKIALSVTRFEALLSTIHKILLRFAPQAGVNQKRKPDEKPSFQPMEDNIPSILVVDDILNWRELLKTILEEEGYQVQTVENGIKAMQAMIEHDYDVVVTDMRLTGSEINNQDGREVAIAAKKGNPDTKVVVITGYPGMTLRAEMLFYDKLFLKVPSGGAFLIDEFVNYIKGVI